MRLVYDTSMMDAVLAQWEQETDDFAALFRHPVFVSLLRRAEEFQSASLSPGEYFHSLLHIDGMDMRRNRKEIIRNLHAISKVDLNQVCQDTARFLPLGAYAGVEDVRVFPLVGIAGLAGDDYIIIDPSPCPLFPHDGSDQEKYLSGFIIPTLRHELHHVGYWRLHPSKPIHEMRNLRDLAEDAALQLQAERCCARSS